MRNTIKTLVNKLLVSPSTGRTSQRTNVILLTRKSHMKKVTIYLRNNHISCFESRKNDTDRVRNKNDWTILALFLCLSLKSLIPALRVSATVIQNLNTG